MITKCATPGRIAALLNRLILACNDGALAHATAAVAMNGTERGGELEIGAGRRLVFAIELSELVRTLGGTPSDGGTIVEGLHALGHWVRTLVAGTNREAAYRACAAVEGRAERLYSAAMDGGLSESIRGVVVRHHAEIAADCERLRQRSMGA